MQLPVSKSLLNRALLIAALCEEETIVNIPENIADDVIRLQEALTAASTKENNEINVGDAGTAYRFLSAYLCLKPGIHELIGSKRMHERPVAALVDALRACGAKVEYTEKEGFPPLRISGGHLKGGQVSIPGNISSQFISALLMIAPLMNEGLKLTVLGDEVSKSYTALTIQMMNIAGISVLQEDGYYEVAPGKYKGFEYQAEADWSGASYAYALLSGADIGSHILLPELSLNSAQGDKQIVAIAEFFGIETKETTEGLMISKQREALAVPTLDMSSCPDIVPSVIVMAVISGIDLELRGVAHLKYKESDRLAAISTELSKIGVSLKEENGTWQLHSTVSISKEAITFNTYGDHRLAMAFSALAMKLPQVIIADEKVVSKSFPDYWNQLENLGFHFIVSGK